MRTPSKPEAGALAALVAAGALTAGGCAHGLTYVPMGFDPKDVREVKACADDPCDPEQVKEARREAFFKATNVSVCDEHVKNGNTCYSSVANDGICAENQRGEVRGSIEDVDGCIIYTIVCIDKVIRVTATLPQ